MAGDRHGDISSTLSDLERKLRDLEHQLQSVSRTPESSATSAAPTGRPSLVAAPPPLEPHTAPAAPAAAPFAAPVAARDIPPAAGPTAPPPAAGPTAPAPPPAAGPTGEDGDQLLSAARSRIEGLSAEIHELRRFGEQLQRATRELVEEYDRVLSRVEPQDADAAGDVHPGPRAAPQLVAAPAPMVAPAPVAAPTPIAAPAPASVPFTAPPPVAAPAPLLPSPADAMTFEGAVVIDAGPFSDIATLSTFEQTLGQVSGVQDVYVRGFEGNRALVDVRLMTPIALVAELRRLLTQPFAVTEARPGHLSVNVDPPPTYVA